MKIPESVRIGGVEYEIEYVENLRQGSRLLYGQIDFENDKLRLSTSDGVGHQHRCITLLHEVLHGIREHSCMEIENEEEVVEMFSKGLYQFLQDNGCRLFDIKSKENDN